MILTIGLNVYYKSDLNLLKRMIFSMLDSESTPEQFVNVDKTNEYIERISKINSITELQMINITEQVECIVFIDYPDLMRVEYQTNIDLIKDYINSLSINNLTFRIVHPIDNVRLSIGRNTIAQLAKGQYICYRDDDDISVNINELISFIKISNYSTLIEAYTMDLNETWTKLPLNTIMSSWSCIVNRQFIIENNLTHPLITGVEDAIWRYNIYWSIMQHNKYSIKLINKVISVYCKASDRCFGKLHPFSEEITSYSAFEMNNNDGVYEIVERIFRCVISTFGHVSINGQLFRSINIRGAARYSLSVIRQWLINNRKYCDEHLKKYISLITKVNGSFDFWSLNDKHKEQCFESFIKYSSLSDLYHFSKSLIENNKSSTNKHQQIVSNDEPSMNKHSQNIANDKHNNDSRTIELLNILFKRLNSWNYIRQHFHKFNNEQLNEFTYKYICFLYIKTGQQLYKISIDAKLLSEIKQFINNYVKINPVADSLLFVHRNYARIKGLMSLPDKPNLVHNCVEYLSKINYNKSIRESLKSKLSPEQIKEIANGLNLYEQSINLSSYHCSNLKFNGTFTDVLISLLLAPTIKANNRTINQQNERIKIIELGNDNIKHIVYKGKFINDKQTLTGGKINSQMTTINDNSRSNYLWLVLLILSSLTIIIIVILIITLVQFKNNQSQSINQ